MALCALMILVWLLSIRLHDVSIVDIVWGPSFLLSALLVLLETRGQRQWIITGLIAIWALRLAMYLAWRNSGSPEDRRYQAMRRKAGASFWWKSLLTVFLLQAALSFVVGVPVNLAAGESGNLSPLNWAGILISVLGIGFEAVGDLQLANFKSKPENHGKVMDAGLWSKTRHPNYFGDFCFWWGIFIVSLARPITLLGVVGPLTMSLLLVRVSGKDLLERGLMRSKPGYQAYIESTPAFFPKPRRKRTRRDDTHH